MVSAANAAGNSLKIQVGYILRFNPVYEKIHEVARAGCLGNIFYMEADYIHTLLDQKNQTDPEFTPVHADRQAGHPCDAEVDDWLDAILNDHPPRTDLRDGAASTLATLIAVEPARAGEELKIPQLR